MSYNIDSIDIVHKKGFCITRTKLERLERENPERPESTVFEFLTDAPRDGWFELVKGPDDVELICPHMFWWSGEGSGHSEEMLIAILSEFEGDADLVLTWEGGDTHTGIRLRDGVVTKHEAVLALGEETKP